MTAAVEQLREKARGYELSAVAAREREQTDAALAWSTVAVVLLEVAAALEHEEAA